jgi:hypothetical protein
VPADPEAEPGDTIDLGSFEDYERHELDRPLRDRDCSWRTPAGGPSRCR